MTKILLVDDDPYIQYMYGRILRGEGYQLLQAADVEQATEILISQPIQLILLDIRIPNIDGRVFKEILDISHLNVKVIVSSAYSIAQQKRDIPGATAYFDKSEGVERLVQLIEEVLSVPSA